MSTIITIITVNIKHLILKCHQMALFSFHIRCTELNKYMLMDTFLQ